MSEVLKRNQEELASLKHHHDSIRQVQMCVCTCMHVIIRVTNLNTDKKYNSTFPTRSLTSYQLTVMHTGIGVS